MTTSSDIIASSVYRHLIMHIEHSLIPHSISTALFFPLHVFFYLKEAEVTTGTFRAPAVASLNTKIHLSDISDLVYNFCSTTYSILYCKIRCPQLLTSVKNTSEAIYKDFLIGFVLTINNS